VGESSPSITSARPPEDRLDSWKEIAAYLNRDVTTVQRWEKREGMPVHRHAHERMGSVYASRAELDAWARRRATLNNGENVADLDASILSPAIATTASPNRSRLVLLLVAATIALAVAVIVWLQRTEYLWRNPITNARFQTITDFGGLEQSAAISRDGQLVAFLSDRDGHMDVWVTHVGSGEFHNLTRGTAPEMTNPLLRTLGFSPDGSLVTYWARRQGKSGAAEIDIWAVPTLGGEPRLYLQGASEFDWSRDSSRLTYHSPATGDPLFVTSGSVQPKAQPIFAASPGMHSHFPFWSPDAKFIYFVEGTLPDKLDIWRIRPEGGAPERITSHNGRVTYPVFVGRRTLMYLAVDSDGSGPSLYSIDPERRIPHRLTSSLEQYTSLAASADGRRLVLTLATPRRTLWRMGVDESLKVTPPAPISVQTNTGFFPRLGSNYLLYASMTGNRASIWKFSNGASTELWSGDGAQFVGSPAISHDGEQVAFSIRQNGQSLLYAIQVDGTSARVVTASLDLQGDPVWSPDGQSLMSAANDGGVPRLFRVPLDGRAPTVFVNEYSTTPTWSPDGRFVVYSGPDVGTTFAVKAATPAAQPYALPPLTLTRGARHLVFLPGRNALVVSRGEIQHKDLWLVDLKSGAERQLTNFAPEFDIGDFDISPDGREIVVERVQERSDVVLLDLARN
jgi:Tol biopolymer transport system component